MEQVRKRHHVRGFSLLVGAITLVIFWMLVPRSCGDQMAAREIAVLREVLRINTAQAQYRSRFGKFASMLAQLGPPSTGVTGPPGPAAADLIPASLASGEKDGYTFILTATSQGYTVNANPKIHNSSARRTFYADQNMIIHQNWSAEPANAGSPEAK